MTSRATELVVKTVSVLRIVASNQGIGLSELSRRSNVPKATALRILTSLRNQSIVWLDENKNYRLALGALSLVPVGVDQSMLEAEVRRELQGLALQVGETTGFDVLVGDAVVVLFQAPGPNLIGQVPNKGPFSQDTWCTSTGRLFLAMAGDDDVRANHRGAVEMFATKRPGRDLFAELATIRERGYSIVHGELSPGASALAVPVKKGTQTVAAVWVGGPTERLARHDEAELRAKAENTANNISRSLSASWPEVELMWNSRT
jgi:IclR family acetate operon transcriptional repressor